MLLLSQGSEVEPRSRLGGQTPLHVAAANRGVRCAEVLLPLMSSVDVVDQNGKTPLHHAAYSGDTEVTDTPESFLFLRSFQQWANVLGFVCVPQMVTLLLSKGADPSVRDNKERQALHWAAYLGNSASSLDSLVLFLGFFLSRKITAWSFFSADVTKQHQVTFLNFVS